MVFGLVLKWTFFMNHENPHIYIKYPICMTASIFEIINWTTAIDIGESKSMFYVTSNSMKYSETKRMIE